jgi:tetratricopeptide (TPR) repeat protein
MLLSTLTLALLLPLAQDPTQNPAPEITPATTLDAAAEALAAARSALGAGELGEALELLRTALAEAPEEPEIRRLLARTLNDLGRGAKALEVLEPALAQLPRSVWLLTEKGRAQILIGEMEAAEVSWRQALTIRPRSGEVRLRLADLLLGQSRVEEAAVVIGPLVEQAGDLVGVVVIRSRLLQAQGRGEEASALLERKIETGFDETALRIALASLLIEQERLDDAWWAVEPLVDTTRDPRTLLFLGRVALRSDRVLDAVAVLAVAMLADPTDREILDEIGEIFEHRHDLHILLAARRVAADDTDARAWKELLSAHVEAGRIARYFEERKRVPEEVLRLPLLRLVEGEALRRAGRSAEARVILGELTQGGGGARAWYELALLEYAEGNPEAAEQAFDRGAQGPWAAQARFNRGVCLDRLGRYQEAVGEYERAVAIQPDFTEAWLQAGLDWRHRLGNAAKARRAFARYLECGGDDPEVRRWMEDHR